MVKSFALARIEVQNEDFLPVWWDHTTTENNLCQLSCQFSSFLTSSFQHLSQVARWTHSLASSRRDLRKLIAWPLKFDIEQPSIMLNPCFHLVFSCRKLTSIITYTIRNTPLTSRDNVQNSIFSVSDFVNQTACLATCLASLWAVFATLGSSVLPPFFRALWALNRSRFPWVNKYIPLFNVDVITYPYLNPNARLTYIGQIPVGRLACMGDVGCQWAMANSMS